jgi:putative phosphoesterase
VTKIGLLSDTHGYLDEAILTHLRSCDEIWHAGDFGPLDVVTQLQALHKPLRGVFGNIDDGAVRALFPETLVFRCEAVTVLMQHIAGYPGRYAPGLKKRLQQEKAGLFISGHSHILKIMYDDTLHCLHINPGAAGKQGWHQVRTLVLFDIDGNNIQQAAVVELGRR